VAALVVGCRHLKHLILTGCNITTRAIDALASIDLESLYLSYGSDLVEIAAEKLGLEEQYQSSHCRLQKYHPTRPHTVLDIDFIKGCSFLKKLRRMQCDYKSLG
jgi:hypothetical protein